MSRETQLSDQSIVIMPNGKTGASAVIRALTSFRSHKICCRDCSENDDVSVDTLVSHNSHSATWVDCSIGLGDLVV